PQQRRQVAELCCEVLLIWAEAEARVGRAGLPGALRLLNQAETLGQAEKLPALRILYECRTSYLGELGDETGAQAAGAQTGGLEQAAAVDHFLLALASYRRGEYEQARQGCEEALRLQPGDFWSPYLQALCYLRENKWA